MKYEVLLDDVAPKPEYLPYLPSNVHVNITELDRWELDGSDVVVLVEAEDIQDIMDWYNRFCSVLDILEHDENYIPTDNDDENPWEIPW